MRARNIKPGFFKNEDLAELGPYAQILFEGLWCLADREGRLENRPKRIKVEIFPYYDPEPSTEELLNQLVSPGFVKRYAVGEVKVIQVVNFSKHQNPHHTEKASIFPPPGDSPLMDGGNLADSRIADSLIPDSLISDCLKKDIVKPPLIPHTPYQKIVDLWNQEAPNGLARSRNWTIRGEGSSRQAGKDTQTSTIGNGSFGIWLRILTAWGIMTGAGKLPSTLSSASGSRCPRSCPSLSPPQSPRKPGSLPQTSPASPTALTARGLDH
jgi:hypothetical protein